MTAALADGSAVELHLSDEGLGVVGAFLPHHAVGQLLTGLPLDVLLQKGLVVPAAFLHHLFPLHVQQNAVDQLRRGGNAAVQIHGGEHSLGCIRQNGGPMAAAAGLLALAQLQIAAQIQLLGHLVKALLAHQRCPDPGQIPLRQVRVPGEEILRRHKAQHAVAQKLQPFVAAKPLGAMLIRVGAVIQRLPQQFLVPEGII